MAHNANQVSTLEDQIRHLIPDSSPDVRRVLMTTREFSDIAFGIDTTRGREAAVGEDELASLPKDGYQYRLLVNTHLRARTIKRLQQILAGNEYHIHAAAGPLLVISPTERAPWYAKSIEASKLLKLLLQLHRQVEAAFVRCAVKHGTGHVKTTNESLVSMHLGGLIQPDRQPFSPTRVNNMYSRIRHQINEILMQEDKYGDPVSTTTEDEEFQEDLKELEKMIAW